MAARRRSLVRIVLAWAFLTLAWCAFVIVLAGRLHAQTPGCYVIDRYQMLCIPSTGEIFVDVAGGPGFPAVTGFYQEVPPPSGLPTPSQQLRQFSPLAGSTATPRIILAHQKLASDGWVDRSKNKNGERCCDSGKDCHTIMPERVAHVPRGVNVTLEDGRVLFIPGQEIMPSEDGRYWLCYWGGQVKCFFAPYSGS